MAEGAVAGAPPAPGVYAVYDAAGTLQYVGLSRKVQHCRGRQRFRLFQHGPHRRRRRLAAPSRLREQQRGWFARSERWLWVQVTLPVLVWRGRAQQRRPLASSCPSLGLALFAGASWRSPASQRTQAAAPRAADCGEPGQPRAGPAGPGARGQVCGRVGRHARQPDRRLEGLGRAGRCARAAAAAAQESLWPVCPLALAYLGHRNATGP